MLPADQDLVFLGEGWQVGHTHVCTHKGGTKGGARKMQGLAGITLTLLAAVMQHAVTRRAH